MPKKNIFASMDDELKARKAAEAEAKRAMREFTSDVDKAVGALVRDIFPELYGPVEVFGHEITVPAENREAYLRDARDMKFKSYVEWLGYGEPEQSSTYTGASASPYGSNSPRVVEE